MKVFSFIICALFVLFPDVSFSQTYSIDNINNTQTYQVGDSLTYTYTKPKFFDFITHIPSNYGLLAKESIKKENAKWLRLTAITTFALLPFDQYMIDKSQQLGNELNLSQTHEHGSLLSGRIIYPTNAAATMYYFGHGNTSLLIGGGLLSYGLLKNDYRALNTASEIVEGILTLGVLTQSLKRVFGRQSPHKATVDGGKWQFLPGLSTYAENVPNYDAMPSGHIAGIMSTTTILSKNYPEKKWIKPIGYTMTALMSYEMMNSGVHWATDYPLGILIGYSVGTVVTNRRIKKEKATLTSSKKSIFADPELRFSVLNGTNLIGVGYTF